MNTKRNKIYARAIGTMAALSMLVVGVTLAAVNTQATLSSSSLSTTSSDLLLWNGDEFASSAPGFTVDNIVPGIGSEEYRVAFKNTGGSTMSIGARVPSTLKFSGFNSTSSSTAMKAVKVSIKNLATGDKVDTTLYSLSLTTEVAFPGPALAGGTTGNPETANAAGNYSIKFDVDPTAIGTVKATVDPFDLVFTGKIVAQ